LNFGIYKSTNVQMELARPTPRQIVISAFRDLDCDGTFVTFQRIVFVTPTQGSDCKVDNTSLFVGNIGE